MKLTHGVRKIERVKKQTNSKETTKKRKVRKKDKELAKNITS